MDKFMAWQDINGKRDSRTGYSIVNMNDAPGKFSIKNMNGVSAAGEKRYSIINMNGKTFVSEKS